MALEKRSAHHENELSETLCQRSFSVRSTLKIVLRNSIYAAIGRIVIGIVKQLAKKGLSRSFFQRTRAEIFSLNPLKWAVVFGGFSCFRLCLHLLRRLCAPLHIPQKAISLAAGCICSLPAFVMNEETRTELCLYLFVRSAHTFSLRYLLPKAPKCMRDFSHYDVLLMCLSSAQISYGCLYAPYSLPKSYHSFLMRASTLDERMVRGHTEFSRRHLTPDMVDYCWEKKRPIFENFDEKGAQTLCDLLHSGYSCNGWAVVFAVRNMFKMGIPLYGPLRVVSMLAFQRRNLIANPVSTILRNVRSVLSSALFLSLYVTIIVRSACFGAHQNGSGGLCTSLLSSLAGLATLLEPKGRRMDLALYCSMYALRSFLLTQNRLGRLPYPRHMLVCIVYVLSSGYIFCEYEEESKLLDHRLRSGLHMLLGDQSPSATRKSIPSTLIEAEALTAPPPRCQSTECTGEGVSQKRVHVHVSSSVPISTKRTTRLV